MIVHEALLGRTTSVTVNPTLLTFLQQRDPATLTPTQVYDHQGNPIPMYEDDSFPVLGIVGIAAGAVALLGTVAYLAFGRKRH